MDGSNDNASIPMNGYEFEEYVAEVFTELGYEANVTPKSNDYGADIILRDPSGRTISVQTKFFGQSALGNGPVQEVVASMAHYRTEEAWVVTNSSFSSNARLLATENHVRLIDGHELKELASEARRRKAGAIPFCCPNCGASLDAEGKTGVTCQYCGTAFGIVEKRLESDMLAPAPENITPEKQKATVNESPGKATKSKRKTYLIVAIVALFLLGAIGSSGNEAAEPSYDDISTVSASEPEEMLGAGESLETKNAVITIGEIESVFTDFEESLDCHAYLKVPVTIDAKQDIHVEDDVFNANALVDQQNSIRESFNIREGEHYSGFLYLEWGPYGQCYDYADILEERAVPSISASFGEYSWSLPVSYTGTVKVDKDSIADQLPGTVVEFDATFGLFNDEDNYAILYFSKEANDDDIVYGLVENVNIEAAKKLNKSFDQRVAVRGELMYLVYAYDGSEGTVFHFRPALANCVFEIIE